MEETANEMNKNMGVMSAISLGVGCVIGAGAFVVFIRLFLSGSR